jgi:signal transduction histidine kinase
MLLAGMLIAINGTGAANASTGADARTALARAFLIWSLLLLPAGALAGWWLGRSLARPLQELRRALLARAGRGTGAPMPASRLAEARELADAAELGLADAARGSARIEAQRDALSTLVESASEGLLRVDAAERIVFANPACRTLLGLPAAPLGLVFPSLVRNSEVRLVLARALKGEQVSASEVTLGRRRLLFSAQPLLGEGGRAGGAVIAIADLTALRHLESVRRDFVANVSHELKTPLTSIRGYVETLLHDDIPPQVRREFLEVVHKNAARLQHIVDDLLDLSRIESGGWQPSLQALSVTELVADAWTSCLERAHHRRLRFEPPSGESKVLADPGALRQVLGNLFDNSVRHTPDDGVISVRVSGGGTARAGPVAPAGPGDWVHIEIRDTGSGIPREALPRIFERFYRADPSRSRADGGTGLGLAIVKHLVESMGGEVHAESTLGQGTAMHVFLRPTAS